MIKHISEQNFITAFLTLNGKIIVNHYENAKQSDGSIFRYVEQDEYDYSIALVQELDELFDCDVLDNMDNPNELYGGY